MLCLRCEQSKILKVWIKKLSKKAFLCDECEASWFKKDNINKLTFIDYGSYMMTVNLLPIFDEIDILSEKL